jgi:hypothetical protein
MPKTKIHQFQVFTVSGDCRLSLQLEAEDAAALNLFADRPGAFADSHIDTAAVLAAHISTLVALHEAENHAAHLHTLRCRPTANSAPPRACSSPTQDHRAGPFVLRRTTSQHLHRKLRDVAAAVVETCTLPDQPTEPSGN